MPVRNPRIMPRQRGQQMKLDGGCTIEIEMNASEAVRWNRLTKDEKQKLLEKMYGKEEGVKGFFKKMFRGIKK